MGITGPNRNVDGPKPKFKVSAEAHSDDRIYEASFDAEPFLAQASDRELARLIQCEWGGDYPADYVAEFAAKDNEEVAKMFDYIHHARDRKKDCGFECHIDQEEAEAWIRENRPSVVQAVELAAKEGANAVEADDYSDERPTAPAATVAADVEVVNPRVRQVPLAEAMAIIESASAIVIDNGLDSVIYPSISELTGDPENEFMYLSWDDDGTEMSTRFKEENNREVTIAGASIFMEDAEGEELIITPLFRNDLLGQAPGRPEPVPFVEDRKGIAKIWVEELEKAGVDAEDLQGFLDDKVHDMKSGEASDINNSGKEAQLAALIDGYGSSAVASMLLGKFKDGDCPDLTLS
jgi:hypothetical protein